MHRWRKAVVAAAMVALCACSGSAEVVHPSSTTMGGGSVATLPGSDDPAAPDVGPSTVRVDSDAPGVPIDPRLFGVNLPAWVGPARLADPGFRQQTVESGATVVRMPGGSWSSEYDWLGCEQGDSSCVFSGPARPSDYAAFLAATGLEGMWTVRFDGTAQEAAALVAFFNGAVDDARPIGVDRNGRDWATVGDWARLRAAGGNPDPVRIASWEVGNEVYGAVADAVGDCASFGWEHTWTCDGSLYATGDDGHDGFVEFREAMLAVDPTIGVGAVGVPDFGSWSDFGNRVLDGTGRALDFYVVHDYGFDSSPSIDDLLARPQTGWPEVAASVAAGLTDHGAADVPIAVTEYNLVAFLDGDAEAVMDTVANGIYTADMIGQMATSGVAMADLWNLINGKGANGSDYGMIDYDTGALNPTYDALTMWSTMGDVLLPVESGFDATRVLTAYATRSADGSTTVLLLNKTSEPLTVDLQLAGVENAPQWTADAVAARSFDADAFTPADVAVGGDGEVTLPGVSITVARNAPG